MTQEASYGTNRIWANNPTFLLSGQLSGNLSLLVLTLWVLWGETLGKRERRNGYMDYTCTMLSIIKLIDEEDRHK